MDWVTDDVSDGSLDVGWVRDHEENKPSAPPLHPSNTRVDNGASCSNTSTMSRFLGMGFPEKLIVEAIKQVGDQGNSDAILDLLLTYQVLENDQPENEIRTNNDNNNSNTNNNNNDTDSGKEYDSDDLKDDFDDFDLDEEMSGRAGAQRKLQTLMEMDFDRDEALQAIQTWGDDAPIDELVDCISAAQTQNGFGLDLSYMPQEEKRRKNRDKYDPFAATYKRPKYETGLWSSAHICSRPGKGPQALRTAKPTRQTCEEHDLVPDAMPLPNPMVGFGLPTNAVRCEHRHLPESVTGPPYFFYENVALAPKGVWSQISRHLYEVEPEFIDSKYYSAAARKRGYIHNLPIANRSPLLPLPPKTIQNAFPHSKRWWPAWDDRKQFNCLKTSVGSASLTKRIRLSIEAGGDPPSQNTRRNIMQECKEWNLIWVGQNRAVTLEPDEVEFLLGFPRNHTRGYSRTERYKSLGNSFQVDTVAYLLSPLKFLFPGGIRVLSLFTGIGGAEVALHRLGVKMQVLVSIEISEINQNILRSWWAESGQEGKLIELSDVQSVTDEQLRKFVSTYGGFDLVIGGSPCDNLTGSNRQHRVGLQGEQSSLFFHYVRILESVRNIMGRRS